MSRTSTEPAEIEALRFIYSSLYRLDEQLLPAPDLAAERCETPDARTWTCRLVEARFHDGTQLTADDVAFRFELAASERCPYRHPTCFGDVISSVRAVDERTVGFQLV